MQKSVIIVAGGSGSRMKSDIPKQFLEIEGKPILMHTIEKFFLFDPLINIIVVLPENQFDNWQSLVEKYNFSVTVTLAKGGNTRFQSVKNGLDFITNGIVGIHDAVRPLVCQSTIEAAFAMALIKGNAIPVIQINESIRKITGNTNKLLDRNSVIIVQTPQCFEAALIKEAYLQEYNPVFTDDASVLEITGIAIHLSEGNPENIKITTPLDMMIAETLMKKS